MGEIKSTLELVMEKTRHMTMSDAERREQNKQEARRKVNGLLQKISDGVLNRERFKAQWQDLQDTVSLDTDFLCKVIAEKFDVEQDNRVWLDLMADCCDADTRRLAALFQHHDAQSAVLAENRQRQLKAHWAERGIKGAAVVPNLACDDDFTAALAQLIAQSRSSLEKALADL